MTDISKGPFKRGEGGEFAGLAVVDVLTGTGHRFCYVAVEDCANGGMAGAKARATRIAESLNRTEGHAA